jgi:ring-1,2-phenylacetyl-CoA epoxidase subunit PaaC
LWGYAHELFEPADGEQALVAAGVVPDRAGLKARWREDVGRTLQQATLERPDDTWHVGGGRTGVHTEHLGHLLAEMQFMQRAYPGQRW